MSEYPLGRSQTWSIILLISESRIRKALTGGCLESDMWIPVYLKRDNLSILERPFEVAGYSAAESVFKAAFKDSRIVSQPAPLS
jgi:hypothetical protein